MILLKVIYKYTLTTIAPSEKIWKIWTNIKKWPTWDKEIEWVKIDGPFITGQSGKLKPKSGPITKFQITSCIPNKQFTTVSWLPFAKLIFDHQLGSNENKTMVTHQISIRGPLAWLFNIILGSTLKQGLENALPQLIKQAEQYEQTH